MIVVSIVIGVACLIFWRMGIASSFWILVPTAMMITVYIFKEPA